MTAGRTNHRLFAAAASQCWQVNSGARCTAARSPGERVCPDCNPGGPNPSPLAPTRFITRSDCSSCSIYANECPGPREDHCPITGEPQCP